jgi:hypothetical protein
MRNAFIVLVLVMAFLALSGCVPGPNALVNTPDEAGRVAGFWQGLWHGIIAPVTFVISLFSDTVHVFETHNNGNWYVFGFLLGLTAVWGGGGRATSRRRP